MMMEWGVGAGALFFGSVGRKIFHGSLVLDGGGDDDEHTNNKHKRRRCVAAAGTWRQMVPAAGSKKAGRPRGSDCHTKMSENLGDATRYYSTHKAANTTISIHSQQPLKKGRK